LGFVKIQLYAEECTPNTDVGALRSFLTYKILYYFTIHRAR